MPVLGVWVDGALHFCAGPNTAKARNLKRDPHCVITAAADALDLVIEGTALRVKDHSTVARAADAYKTKYAWDAEPRGDAFYGEGAPTAGPPPLDLYRFVPALAFGFGTDESLSAMRWEFRRDSTASPK